MIPGIVHYLYLLFMFLYYVSTSRNWTTFTSPDLCSCNAPRKGSKVHNMGKVAIA